jgi:hypothetical protein
MANRPRRSGAIQTFAVPDEDDIYDDLPASIAPLEEEIEPMNDVAVDKTSTTAYENCVNCPTK